MRLRNYGSPVGQLPYSKMVMMTMISKLHVNDFWTNSWILTLCHKFQHKKIIYWVRYRNHILAKTSCYMLPLNVKLSYHRFDPLQWSIPISSCVACMDLTRYLGNITTHSVVLLLFQPGPTIVAELSISRSSYPLLPSTNNLIMNLIHFLIKESIYEKWQMIGI